MGFKKFALWLKQRAAAVVDWAFLKPASYTPPPGSYNRLSQKGRRKRARQQKK